jgi:CO dehydrogenase/acetyl-CoA synthase delta subunit
MDKLDRVRKMVHDAIVRDNVDVDPTTLEYGLAVSYDKITLFYYDDATREFTSCGEFRVMPT